MSKGINRNPKRANNNYIKDHRRGIEERYVFNSAIDTNYSRLLIRFCLVLQKCKVPK